MAELFINLRRPTHPLHHHVGDVIVAMPDGHAWTRLELEDADRVIVRAPLLATHVDVLTFPHVDVLTREMIALRGHRLDIERVPHFVNARRRDLLNEIVVATRTILENVTVAKETTA